MSRDTREKKNVVGQHHHGYTGEVSTWVRMMYCWMLVEVRGRCSSTTCSLMVIMEVIQLTRLGLMSLDILL